MLHPALPCRALTFRRFTAGVLNPRSSVVRSRFVKRIDTDISSYKPDVLGSRVPHSDDGHCEEEEFMAGKSGDDGIRRRSDVLPALVGTGT